MDFYNQTLTILEEIIPGETGEDILHSIGTTLFKHRFKGVYASDEIPSMNNGDMIIVNLDKRSQPGSHWIALAMTKSKTGKLITNIYDSYGRDLELGITNTRDTEYDAEQTISETNCGARVLAWLWTYYRLGITTALTI